MVNIIKDVDAIYETDKYDVVLVGTNTHNMLCGSFQNKIGHKYPIVAEVNDKTAYGDLRKLGKRITIDDQKPIISLMYICTYPTHKKPYINYEALENCLRTANSEFKGKKVMTVMLGSTKFDGNGDREKCLELIRECTKDMDVDIYDYQLYKFDDEVKMIQKYFRELKKDHADDKEALAKIREMEKQAMIETYIVKKK